VSCRDGTQYVIIGNGIAGTTAAEVLRRADPGGCVSLITDEPYPLYNRVALPRFLKGQVREEKVLMRTPEAHEKLGINLLLETKVTAVSLEERVVLTDRGQAIPFDRLLIASGGRPNRLSVPGADACGVFNFQTLDDTKAILEALKTARRAWKLPGSSGVPGFCTGTWTRREGKWLTGLPDGPGLRSSTKTKFRRLWPLGAG
jgi:3-phenylpropionate/trans-cinnamate dioxygenase ferredoxin reductase subunit